MTAFVPDDAPYPRVSKLLRRIEWVQCDTGDCGVHAGICPECGAYESGGMHLVGCELKFLLDRTGDDWK